MAKNSEMEIEAVLNTRYSTENAECSISENKITQKDSEIGDMMMINLSITFQRNVLEGLYSSVNFHEAVKKFLAEIEDNG